MRLSGACASGLTSSPPERSQPAPSAPPIGFRNLGAQLISRRFGGRFGRWLVVRALWAAALALGPAQGRSWGPVRAFFLSVALPYQEHAAHSVRLRETGKEPPGFAAGHTINRRSPALINARSTATSSAGTWSLAVLLLDMPSRPPPSSLCQRRYADWKLWVHALARACTRTT